MGSEIATIEKVRRSAEISDCGRHRYWLRRDWSGGDGRVVCFVMLNPSTADAMQDDPTIRRCIGYAKAWGFSSLSVRNLFTYRATDPKELLKADNPSGGTRGNVELQTARTADLVIAAWGCKVPFRRDEDAERLLKGVPVYCLKLSNGKPHHPLYLPKELKPIAFWNVKD
jgi:hypothetical protein